MMLIVDSYLIFGKCGLAIKGVTSEINYGIIREFFPSIGAPPPLLGTSFSTFFYGLFCVLGSFLVFTKKLTLFHYSDFYFLEYHLPLYGKRVLASWNELGMTKMTFRKKLDYRSSNHQLEVYTIFCF